jgi:VWFA-related protein
MRKVFISIFLCFWFLSPIFSQIEEEVHVDLIEIWAKVTDGNRRIVTDLGPEDFEVFIDGKKMQIRCFDKTFASSDSLTSDEDSGSKKTDRKFVFFFDLLNTQDADILFLKQKIIDFLSGSFLEGDEAMVFVLLPSTKLGIVQKMTSNKEGLIDVVNRMRGNTMLQTRTWINERQLLDLLYMGGGSTSGSSPLESSQAAARSVQAIRQAQSLAQSFARFEENLCNLTLSSFVSIADYLSGNRFPGRVVMIYASGGFSLYPGQNYYDIVDKAVQNQAAAATEDLILPDHPDLDFSREVRNVIGLLNRQNVTIYSVDASGLAENDDSVVKDTAYARLGVNNLAYARTLQDSLYLVAQETGGIAYSGGQNYQKGLAEIAADMAQQYWLCSNLPSSNNPGTYHKVEVKVLRPGLQVRYRKGYVD